MSSRILHSSELHLSPADVAGSLTPAELKATAALHGAPDGVAEIVANGWSRGTRDWALEYGVVEEDRRGELRVTPFGYQVFDAAAQRCPHPYADVSVADLTVEVRALVDAASGDSHASQVVVPARRSRQSVSRRVSDAGFALTEQIADLFHVRGRA